MKKKLNIGILGCAHIAERSIIPAIRELGGQFNFFGIASRKQQKADQFAARFNTKGFKGYASLLDEACLDAVYVPLPNALHAEWVGKALKKGLHVLVEKSLACGFKEAKMLNDMAKKKSLVLLENFQFRFHCQLDFIKKIVKEGKIGRLRSFRSSFCFPPFSDANNIRYNKKLGGGALLDAGAYPVKISQIFLGENLNVKAASLCYDARKGVDIWGGAYLKQNDGSLFSEITFGFDNFYQCNVELVGSKGRIYTNRIFTASIGYEPVIELETNSGKETIRVSSDNPFKKILFYFHNLIISKESLAQEYRQNIDQARLISELRRKANE